MTEHLEHCTADRHYFGSGPRCECGKHPTTIAGTAGERTIHGPSFNDHRDAPSVSGEAPR